MQIVKQKRLTCEQLSKHLVILTKIQQNKDKEFLDITFNWKRKWPTYFFLFHRHFILLKITFDRDTC